MRTDLKIPYGVADFKRLRNEGLYYVDKTRFLAQLEERDSFVFFVRPRRFGKSLFISMMQCYYDRREEPNFDKLFGGLWLGEHPTENRNRYLVLPLDFSKVGGIGGETLEAKFANYMDAALDDFIARYSSLFPPGTFSSVRKETKYKLVTDAARANGLPLYLIIDEYDNFTNSLIRLAGTDPYRAITHGAGFYRNWFKLFKGSFDRIFMTGVSPVTMDDLTSGFNIAANVSQDDDFNAMLGFTEEETLAIYRDFRGVGAYLDGDPEMIVRSIKPWYDGYCFSEDKIDRESVFNSDMVLYHLKSLVSDGHPPKNMVDRNIATDYDKLQMIADLQRLAGERNVSDVSPITEQLAAEGEIAFRLVDSFPAEKIIEPDNFQSLFFYYGILSMVGTRGPRLRFGIPNACVRQQLFAYLHGYYMDIKGVRSDRLDDLAEDFATKGNWEPLLRRFAENFNKTTPVRGALDGEIRIQGYMQAEFAHLGLYLVKPEMELSRGFSDFCLFPDPVHGDFVRDSYIIELKYSKPGATDAELAAKAEEGIAQLRRYAADPTVPALAKDTRLHLLLYQFKGAELVRLEEIPG